MFREPSEVGVEDAVTAVDLRGESNFFHFHAVFGKK